MRNLRIKTHLQSLTTIFLFSCGNGNYQDVVISGVLKDADKLPIANAKVTVNCWAYNTKTWDTQSTQKVVFSDSVGFFKALFEEGEAVDLQVVAIGFKPYEQSITLDRNKLKVDATLEK